MREPKRIDTFCDEFAKVWKENCPDWRFGQLMSNISTSCSKDIFNMEEDEMMKCIKAYFNIPVDEDIKTK